MHTALRTAMMESCCVALVIFGEIFKIGNRLSEERLQRL